MSNERIDLTRFEKICEHGAISVMCRLDAGLPEPIYDKNMIEGTIRTLLAELKRCYEKNDWLQQVADLAADNIGRKNWDGFEEAMYEAGLWERPSE